MQAKGIFFKVESGNERTASRHHSFLLAVAKTGGESACKWFLTLVRGVEPLLLFIFASLCIHSFQRIYILFLSKCQSTPASKKGCSKFLLARPPLASPSVQSANCVDTVPLPRTAGYKTDLPQFIFSLLSKRRRRIRSNLG